MERELEYMKKIYTALAPMADVTDAPFRKMFALHGKPDFIWGEFISADGLFLRPFNEIYDNIPKNEFQETLIKYGISLDHPLALDLLFNSSEKKNLVAQFFSNNPQRMEKAARLAYDLGYDSVDINMGCPSDSICAQGAGAAIIKRPDDAIACIRSVKTAANGRMMSVKTRSGYYSHSELNDWISLLLKESPDILTLHARTKKEMSKVPAQWSDVEEVVKLRDIISPETLIFGNGDVVSLLDGKEKSLQVGSDGFMVGRGVFGNPWFFSKDFPKESQSEDAIILGLLEHMKYFHETFGDRKPFMLMKKHIKAYLSGIQKTKDARLYIMEEVHEYEQAKKALESLL
jgi:tRNA-dihydrouridine synthase